MIQIDNEIKAAMRKLSVLKLIKTEFTKKQTEPGRKTHELSEEEQMAVLMKMASQREDSIKQYTDGGREDLAENEREELKILSKYLPKQASNEEIAELVETIVKGRPEPVTMKDMKAIMEAVKKKYPTANGKVVSQALSLIISKGN